MRIALLFFAATAIVSTCHAWQQRVDYIMTVKLDPAARTITGSERIDYRNNSNEALGQVFAHLYWNAFQPGSMMEAQLRRMGETGQANRIANLSLNDQGHVTIDSVIVNGHAAPFTILGTILHVTLATPITQGSNADIIIAFSSHVPALVRRAGYMSTDSVEFSMAQWYPEICSYDDFGWHPDEYLGREFSGEFGSYQVNIVTPYDYCVAATGQNMNPMSSGCGYNVHVDTTILFPAARDSNVRDAHGNILDSQRTRGWQFHADNVHDFAWAADREFVHQIVIDKFRTIHVFYKRKFLQGWKDIGTQAVKALQYFSDRYGTYAYNSVSVIQAGDGGMEYPQCVFLNGIPSRGTLVHELAHQWFYGIIGNNESAEAWLDEGFTTFVTTRALRDLYTDQKITRSWLGRMLLPVSNPRQDEYRPYMRMAMSGHEEPVMQHSDAFTETDGYREVYYKTHAILNMLEYVVGDSVFARIMRAYCLKYRLARPTTEGFIRICRDVSGMELDWFFDEWLRTTKTCDYALDDYSSVRSDAGFASSISLHRSGDAVMPVDVELTYANGDRQLVTVPNGWYAKSERGNIVLPQWGPPDPDYRAQFTTPSPITSAVIDPTMRLQDVNRLNNSPGWLPPMRVEFLTRFDAEPPLDVYGVSLVPRIWYSELQGAKIGASFNGGYTYDRYKLDGGFTFNTLHQTADWWMNYRWHATPDADVYFSGAREYGIRSVTLTATQRWKPLMITPFEHRLSLSYEYTAVPVNMYPFYTMLWNSGELNTAKATFEFIGSGAYPLDVTADFETSLTRQTGFTRVDLHAGWSFPISALTTHIHMDMGSEGGAVPIQKRFYLSAADPEEQFHNTVYRGIAMVQEGIDTLAHFFLPGGGRLSGYDDQYVATSGQSLFTFSGDVACPIFYGEHRLSLAAFGGWGYVSENSLSTAFALGAPYGNAGVAVRYEFVGSDASLIQSLLMTHAPLRVEVALPLFVSRPIDGDKKIALRVRVGISAGL